MSDSHRIAPVEGKVDAVLICEHRQLKQGETAKRRGQTTVYEATGQVDPVFLDNLGDYIASVKLDGTSCKITVDPVTNIARFYKRRDIRDGNIPNGAIPGSSLNEKGQPDIAWIDITDSTDPDDKYHLAAIHRELDTNGVTTLKYWTIDTSNTPVLKVMTNGTFELVGPAIQNNPYGLLKDSLVPVRLNSKSKKGEFSIHQLPRHYLFEHGCFPVKDFDFNMFLSSDPVSLSQQDPVQRARDFIVNNRIEGIVFHPQHEDFPMFKINRGHIGVDIEVDHAKGIHLNLFV